MNIYTLIHATKSAAFGAAADLRPRSAHLVSRISPRAMRYSSAHARRAAHAQRRPEAVPQRADNCVTRRNTVTDADELATEPFRPDTDDAEKERRCTIAKKRITKTRHYTPS